MDTSRPALTATRNDPFGKGRDVISENFDYEGGAGFRDSDDLTDDESKKTPSCPPADTNGRINGNSLFQDALLLLALAQGRLQVWLMMAKEMTCQWTLLTANIC